MPSELDQIVNETKSILAQCQISANQAAAAAAAIGNAGLAPLESPLFTGDPRAPTPADGNVSASIATTAWIGAKLTQPNGIATLDNNGIVPISQLPFTGLNSQGAWDANTNTPHLTSGSGVGGNFYIVSANGSTNLDGITTWNVGDWALFSSGAWTRVPYVAPPFSNIALSSLEGIPTNTMVANTMAGSASPQAIAISSITSLLNIMLGDLGSGGAKGLVPAPPVGSAGSGAFLSADGTFKVPPGPNLSAYATLNSPAFTGTATAATQARDLNSTALATTAYVINQQGRSTEVAQIKVNGTVSAGTATYAAKLDHIHPTDTSRMAAANGAAFSPTFTGTATMTGTLTVTGAILLNGSSVGGGGSSFVAGTALVFAQAAAPTGWTKSASHNDKAMRVVSGTTGGAAGGTVAFSTVFARTATDGHSLTAAENGPHNHNLNVDVSAGDTGLSSATSFGSSNTGGSFGRGGAGSPNSSLVASSGSGTAHTHPMDIRVQYVDVIICTKD